MEEDSTKKNLSELITKQDDDGWGKGVDFWHSYSNVTYYLDTQVDDMAYLTVDHVLNDLTRQNHVDRLLVNDLRRWDSA